MVVALRSFVCVPGFIDRAQLFSARLSRRDRARLVKVVIYETGDPAEKVIAFYKENLKGKTQVFESKRGRLPSAAIRTEVGGVAKLLMITSNEDTGKTEISIGNISEEPVKEREEGPGARK